VRIYGHQYWETGRLSVFCFTVGREVSDGVERPQKIQQRTILDIEDFVRAFDNVPQHLTVCHNICGRLTIFKLTREKKVFTFHAVTLRSATGHNSCVSFSQINKAQHNVSIPERGFHGSGDNSISYIHTTTPMKAKSEATVFKNGRSQ
jgi:hypothetical protein